MRYAFGDYLLDAQRYELHCAGKPVPLRPKAFEVLAYLLAHRERIISKVELLKHLWPGQFVGDATLNSCIKEVRKAIGDRGAMPCLLRTVRGRGYRFEAPVEEADQPRPEGGQHVTLLPAALAAGDHLSPSTLATAASEPELIPADMLDIGEEYKAVTVLCVALAEAPALAERLGPEAMHQVMQAVVAHTQDVVGRYEGAIVHVTGEGFTALFGAPMAQEDHARRAVLAALELRQRLQEHPAICIHTSGEALAARLQQRAAPGAILISAVTHRLVQAEVRAEACAILESDGLAEAYRLQGEFLLRQARPDVAQAEACFQQALAIALGQQAKSWELRAAMSLSRLWQRQGKREETRQLLAAVYNWFTEGFDTVDLQEAKALLAELSRNRPRNGNGATCL
jgi:DNA-binding winged helix-turn-helix (wHTH) protein